MSEKQIDYIQAEDYYPSPDTDGGWRTLKDPKEILDVTGIDLSKLDEAFDIVEKSTKNGGLLVLRKGWLVYERYFGKGHRESLANLASCGKSFTSICMGILLSERRELFPDGLDQNVYTSLYLPEDAFPLSDPDKKEIKLGQLLAFTAGIRGNNPGYVYGKEKILDPIGPDGWQSCVDAIAYGHMDGEDRGIPFTTSTLWCKPGEGYSYATSSIHLVSLILNHITGIELQEYIEHHLARPMGWGRWGYGYRNYYGPGKITHTPGGGGIVLRPTDMLRFGYLMLRRGRWLDKQLIPEEYVEHCSRRSPYNPHFPYSLQFNVNTDGDIPELPRDAFWKSGSGGHCLYIVPSLDLVVWKLGGRDDQYSANNTGMAIHPEAAANAGDREGWVEEINTGTALIKTLQMVIESII